MSDSSRGEFHRPVRFPGEKFAAFRGGEDPAQILRVARETARTLVERVRDSQDEELLERVVAYTDANGIDAVAELWARSAPNTLPGALWRIYLLRALIRQRPEDVSFVFRRGTEVLQTIDPLVAGAGTPTGPDEITELADRILRGVFNGDLAVALERAAAFCRVSSAGAVSLATDAEATNADRAAELTTRSLRFSTTADELADCARLWRAGSLD